MSKPHLHLTPYSDVNNVLIALLSHVQAILGHHFIGLYLYGSLASGEFDPQRSDIDFLVVTSSELPGEFVPSLESMHLDLAASGEKWAKKLEGTYLPLASLRRFNPDDPPRPCVNEGRFYLGRQGSDWIIQRHVLRETPFAVTGPDLRPFIDPVTSDDLRRSVRAILQEWWLPMLDNPAWLRDGEYQAYAVLTMCRALNSLHAGEYVSKPAAARWALRALDQRWAGLIQAALEWQPGSDWQGLDETLAFIRWTLDESRQ